MTLVRCYPIGVITMMDGGKMDEKIIAIPVDDPNYNSYRDITELPKHIFDEMTHFFSTYKALENKQTVVDEVRDREAALTVRLLEQFLRAGIEPAPALKTLNSALALRGETGGAFTTIDLLALRRSTGEATLYKYGAAPSYLKHTAHVTRFTAHSLPAGLQATTEPPEVTRLALPAGSYIVLISDGIADENSDEWLQNLLAGWNGTDVHALTALILSESRSRRGLEDDCAVLAVHLPLPGENRPRQV